VKDKIDKLQIFLSLFWDAKIFIRTFLQLIERNPGSLYKT